MLIALDLTTNW